MKDEYKNTIDDGIINDEYVPAPSASVKNLDLNRRKLNI